MIQLIFTNETNARFTEETFAPLLENTESHLGPITEKELELILVHDPEMRALNMKTRQIDTPTDVLSFANREVEDPTLKHPDSLGQIFISIDTAQKNAGEMQQSLEDEVKFLFIHGVLHLLGYDHQTPEEESTMKAAAYEILGR